MQTQCSFALLEIILALAVAIIILLSLLIFISAVFKLINH